MTGDRYDAIVLGCGGMGSAALFDLARRGLRVLGLEQFDFAHARGSSHGRTRIIRTAYYEHPDYVPLVRHAFEKWRDLERITGRTLLTPSPCVTVGAADGELIRGVQSAAAEHGLSITTRTAAELMRACPQFRVPSDWVGVEEQDAGILAVENCVAAHLDAARVCGAELHANEPVLAWHADSGGVEVRTAAATYRAAKLVVTAGAWATRLLADIGVPLTVMRQTMLWFTPLDAAAFAVGRFPIFLLDTPAGAFYGLPADDLGVKVARHYAAPELADPAAVDWAVSTADEWPVRRFLNEYLPGAAGPLAHAQACMYTLTPDRHFVIDVHPRHPNVVVACGFSGHGFKFAPAVGAALADLVEDGTTRLPIQLFRAGERRA